MPFLRFAAKKKKKQFEEIHSWIERSQVHKFLFFGIPIYGQQFIHNLITKTNYESGLWGKKMQTCMPKAWLILHPYPRIYFFYLQTDPYIFIINLINFQ